MQISVDLGLLPPDTKIETGKRKQIMENSSSPKRIKEVTETLVVDNAEEDSNDDDNECESLVQPPPPLDPEHSLDGRNHPTAPTTVHWDPKSADGKKIGWKIRVALNNNTWADGRIVRYDPYSHKHKIRMQHNGRTHHVWIWIRNDQHNVYMATRMVWAHVKGHAWSPAMVMENNRYDPSQPLQVEFFRTREVNSLKNSPESIQPFSPHQLHPIVAKAQEEAKCESI